MNIHLIVALLALILPSARADDGILLEGSGGFYPTTLAFAPNERYLAAAAAQTLVWNPSGKLARRIPIAGSALGFSADGAKLAVFSMESGRWTIDILTLPQGPSEKLRGAQSGMLFTAALQEAAAAARRRGIELRSELPDAGRQSSSDGSVTVTVRTHPAGIIEGRCPQGALRFEFAEPLRAALLSRSGKRLALAVSEGLRLLAVRPAPVAPVTAGPQPSPESLALEFAEEQARRNPPAPFPEARTGIAFSPDEAFMAATDGKGLALWSVASRSLLRRIDIEDLSGDSYFSKDGRFVVVIRRLGERKYGATLVELERGRVLIRKKYKVPASEPDIYFGMKKIGLEQGMSQFMAFSYMGSAYAAGLEAEAHDDGRLIIARNGRPLWAGRLEGLTRSTRFLISRSGRYVGVQGQWIDLKAVPGAFRPDLALGVDGAYWAGRAKRYLDSGEVGPAVGCYGRAREEDPGNQAYRQGYEQAIARSKEETKKYYASLDWSTPDKAPPYQAVPVRFSSDDTGGNLDAQRGYYKARAAYEEKRYGSISNETRHGLEQSR